MPSAQILCVKCGAASPEPRPACAKCGGKNARVCGACGNQNSLPKNFCDKCGESLASSGIIAAAPVAPPGTPATNIPATVIRRVSPPSAKAAFTGVSGHTSESHPKPTPPRGLFAALRSLLSNLCSKKS